MHETPDDLKQLQKLLDDSYASAGEHLLSIHTPKRRLKAGKLCDLLTGVRVLVLATVSSEGAPIAGPVDGLFYRGRFYFGSSSESVRFKHLRKRPEVSAVHTVGEELSVVVHGTAQEFVLTAPEHEGFREYVLEVYGRGSASFFDANPYAVIEPRKMFTFYMAPAKKSSG